MPALFLTKLFMGKKTVKKLVFLEGSNEASCVEKLRNTVAPHYKIQILNILDAIDGILVEVNEKNRVMQRIGEMRIQFQKIIDSEPPNEVKVARYTHYSLAPKRIKKCIKLHTQLLEILNTQVEISKQMNEVIP